MSRGPAPKHTVLTVGGTATAELTNIQHLSLKTNGAADAILQVHDKASGTLIDEIGVLAATIYKTEHYDPPLGSPGEGTVSVTITGAGAKAYIHSEG